MNTIHLWCEGLLVGMWRTSWQVAALVCLVLVVQFVFRRWLSPRWRYALWLLVIARLFLPVVPQVPMGFVPWEAVASSDGSSPLEVSNPASTPALHRGDRPQRSTVELPVASTAPAVAVVPSPSLRASVRVDIDRKPPRRPRTAPSRSPTAPPPLTTSTTRPDDAPPTSRWPILVATVWLLGVAFLLARVLWGEHLFRRGLATATPVRDPAVTSLLGECRRKAGIRRQVQVVVTDLVSTPAVCGVLRPRLLLPPHVLADFSTPELRCVFLHELHHLRRPDVLLNAVLAGIGCLYWFHPLVRVAVARVRRAQEELRDWEALSTESAPAPTHYAKTVLKLLESRSAIRNTDLAVGFLPGGRQTRQRILMIANFDRRSAHAWSLGAGLFLLLGWASFTSAAPPASPGTDQAVQGGGTAAEIQVERHQPPPAWWAEFDRALEIPYTCSFQDAPVSAVFDHLREVTGLNFVLQASFRDDHANELLSLQLNDVSTRKLLNIVCQWLEDDISYCYARHAVCVGYEWELPRWTDLRIYRIGPLLDSDDDAEDLVGLVVDFTRDGEGTWDREGVSIEFWNGLLFVRQTDAVHARVHGFLSDILRRSTAAAVDRSPEEAAWRAALRQQLATTRLSVDFDETPLDAAAAHLGELLGVPVLVTELHDDEPISLILRDATAEDVLGWMADEFQLRALLRDHVITLTDDLELVRAIFDIEELNGLVGPDEYLPDNLDYLIRSHVSPSTWEGYDGPVIAFWHDLLIVRATPEMNAEIAQLLEALTRAVR